MSVGGCFVESRLGPAVGDRLELEVHIDGIAPTRLSGVVAYACPPIGFGVTFTIDAAGVAALEETLFRRQACSTA
jgi:hypothetical protein